MVERMIPFDGFYALSLFCLALNSFFLSFVMDDLGKIILSYLLSLVVLETKRIFVCEELWGDGISIRLGVFIEVALYFRVFRYRVYIGGMLGMGKFS
jgi:hypothetical protein